MDPIKKQTTPFRFSIMENLNGVASFLIGLFNGEFCSHFIAHYYSKDYEFSGWSYNCCDLIAKSLEVIHTHVYAYESEQT